MALLHWRKFAFFDEEVLDNTEINQLLNSSDQSISVELSCSNSGRGNILLGDTNGYVYIVNKHLKLNSFRANQKFTSHIKQVPKLPIFITCGSDQDGVNPVVKLWDLDKTDRLNQPTCIRLIRANSGFITPTRVTCVECNDSLSIMVLGFEDGSIVTYYGDITRQLRSKRSGPVKISDVMITGILFRTNNTAFISTEEEIFYVNLSERSFSKALLDQLGCHPKCCCILPCTDGLSAEVENLFAVGRDKAVYFYQIDGRGPCLAFEGEKLLLYRFKSYLVILSRESAIRGESSLLRARRSQASNLDLIENYPRRVNLNIYDIKNKYIAHSSTIPDAQELVSDLNQLYVICKNGKVVLFREKDTQTKLDILFKKNQFGLVIDIAKSHQYNEDTLTDIFKHYGDHLYRKSDFDGAIAQYIRTIGRSEPSYVIKKFLDSGRISNLTVYLEALHQHSQASQDHTKLLLHCYSKLRNDQQLKQFIESYEERNIKFDVEIAIKVLRGAGFHEFAIFLAKKHQKHELFFKVQIEDLHDCEAALAYMNDMIDSSEMATYMKRYGRIMLKNAPEQTISMVTTICQRSRERFGEKSSLDNVNFGFAQKQVYPEEFFHMFVDNNDSFIKLLEQLVEGGTGFATKAVHNLLLGLYLNTWRKEKDDLLRNAQADKIKKLLSQPQENFDMDQALILCRNNRFDEGLMDLYARAQLYNLVLQYHIDQDDSLKIIKTCEEYGLKDPELYKPALIHYSKTGDERLSQLLKVIEHHETMPPMVVIQILLESKRALLGSVKDYLVRFLSKLNDNYKDNENAIDRYRGSTENVRKKIEEFENDQTVFKPSKCSACQNILDLPSVHFLCNHSYHQNCFHNYSAENDECPICVTSNRELLDEIGSHETSKSSLNKLEICFATNDDVFSSLAKLFGYGLFN